jgi:hypothetical protein
MHDVSWVTIELENPLPYASRQRSHFKRKEETMTQEVHDFNEAMALHRKHVNFTVTCGHVFGDGCCRNQSAYI